MKKLLYFKFSKNTPCSKKIEILFSISIDVTQKNNQVFKKLKTAKNENRNEFSTTNQN